MCVCDLVAAMFAGIMVASLFKCLVVFMVDCVLVVVGCICRFVLGWFWIMFGWRVLVVV